MQKIALGISVFPKSSFGHCEIFKGLIKFTTDLMNFQIFDKNFTIYFALLFSLISPIYELNAGKENNPDPKRFSDSFLKFSKQDIEKGHPVGILHFSLVAQAFACGQVSILISLRLICSTVVLVVPIYPMFCIFMTVFSQYIVLKELYSIAVKMIFGLGKKLLKL